MKKGENYESGHLFNKMIFKESLMSEIRESFRKDKKIYYEFQTNIATSFIIEYLKDEKKYKNRQDIHRIANRAAKNYLKLWLGF